MFHSTPCRLHFMAFAMISILGTLVLRADPVPILMYDFDGGSAAGAAPSKGSNTTAAVLQPSINHPSPLLSKDGEGVTGKPGDFALDLRGATGMGRNGEGGVALVSHPGLPAFKSFTLAGWYKSAVPPSGGARLFDYTSPKAGFLLSCGDGKIGLQVNDRGWSTATLPPVPPGVWVFFAVTYDSTAAQNGLVFYQGIAGGDLVNEVVPVNNPEEMGQNPTDILALGNWPSGQRPFQGLLDLLSLYGSPSDGSGALTSGQIHTLFTSAGANPPTTSPTP